MVHLVAAAATAHAGLNGTMIVTLAVSAVCGWAIPAIVDLVTKSNASTALKTLIATALAAVAGALTTVTYMPHERWQDYLLAIAVAVVNTQAAHRTIQGLGDPFQKIAPQFGIGGQKAA